MDACSIRKSFDWEMGMALGLIFDNSEVLLNWIQVRQDRLNIFMSNKALLDLDCGFLKEFASLKRRHST